MYMGSLHLAQEILDIIYPVGSVYLTVNDINPKTLFGGTWVKSSGGFIYGSTSTGTRGENGNGTGTSVSSAGGGTTGSTTLTINQIPSHQHNIQGANSSGSSVNWTDRAVSYSTDAVGYNTGIRTNYQGGGQGHTHTLSNHSHTIPYFACYIWKRTA